MTSQDHIIVDTIDRKTHKDLPPLVIIPNDKPLPPIREPRARPPSRTQNDDSRRTSRLENNKSDAQKRKTSKDRKGSSKISLFNIFSRPKVEKLRGYTEPDLSLTPIDESLSRSVTPDLKSSMLRLEKPHPPLPRPSTAMSSHAKDPPRPSREGRMSTGGEEPSRPFRRRASWSLPPLFQAQAQAVKAGKAQTSDGTGSLQVTRRRRDSRASLVEPERVQRNMSITSIQYTELPKKVFVLTANNCLLQYTDQGQNERLPERFLQLTAESVASACDTVPGEQHVLQISQDPDGQEAGTSSSMSFFSRLGLRGSLARKEAFTLLLVFSNAQDMDSWMATIREQIRLLSGNGGQAEVNNIIQEAGTVGFGKEGKTSAVSRHLEPPCSPRSRVPCRQAERPQDQTQTDASAGMLKPPLSQFSKLLATSSADRLPTHRHQLSLSKSETGSQVKTSRISDSSLNATPQDSPMASPPHDTAVNTASIKNKFPFKLRSSVPEIHPRPTSPLVQPKNAFASASIDDYSSPMNTPRNTCVFDGPPKLGPPKGEESRPDSIVADLPSPWSLQSSSRIKNRTPSALSQAEMKAKQDDPKLKPLRTSEPYSPRRPSTSTISPLTLTVGSPTKIKELSSTPSKSSEVNDSSTKQPSDTDAPTEQPRRTSSIKFSLFPSPSSTPQTTGIRSITPALTTKETLRRPASLQVRANPTPILSSVRGGGAGAGGTSRPGLKKAGSTPSLRGPRRDSDDVDTKTNGEAKTDARSATPSSFYKFSPATIELHGNAFLHSRSVTPNPAPISATTTSTTTASRDATAKTTNTTKTIIPTSITSPKRKPVPQPQMTRDRNESITALPPPPAQASKPRQSSASRPSTSMSSRNETSGAGKDKSTDGLLPALDLGIPVIALAPPVPPPTRRLPSLPRVPRLGGVAAGVTAAVR